MLTSKWEALAKNPAVTALRTACLKKMKNIIFQSEIKSSEVKINTEHMFWERHAHCLMPPKMHK